VEVRGRRIARRRLTHREILCTVRRSETEVSHVESCPSASANDHCRDSAQSSVPASLGKTIRSRKPSRVWLRAAARPPHAPSARDLKFVDAAGVARDLPTQGATFSTPGRVRVSAAGGFARSNPTAYLAATTRSAALHGSFVCRPSNRLTESWIRDVPKLQPPQPSGRAGRAAPAQFAGARRVSLPELQTDGAGTRVWNASSKPLPDLSVERPRGRSPRRSRRVVWCPDGAHRDLGQTRRRVGAGTPLQRMRLPEEQSHRRRRQRIPADVTGGAAGRAAAISTRRTGPAAAPARSG